MATNVGEIYIGLTFDTSAAEGGLKNFEKRVSSATNSTQQTMSKWTVAVGNLISSAFEKISSTIMQSLDYGIKRADILNRFPIAIQNMGLSAEDASKTLQKLSDYTLGLSTHLDDAASSTLRLAGQLGDVEKAEKVFEALNNLALSGATSTSIQATAIEQWTQAISRGRFDIQKEFNAMTVANARAVKELAKQLLGASASTDDLYTALQKGRVSMDDFLAALLDINENGTGSIAALSKSARDADKGIETALERLNTKIGKVWTQIIDTIGWENIINVIDIIGDAFTFLGQQISGIVTAFQRFGVWLREGQEGLDKLDHTTKLVAISAKDYQNALDEAASAANSLNEAQDDLVASQKELVSIQRELAAINGDVASAYINMQDKIDAATKAARANNMAYEDAVAWAKEYRGDMSDLTSGQLELMKAVSSAISAENNYNSALEKRAELDENVISQQSAIEKAYNSISEAQYQMAYAQQYAVAAGMLTFGEYEKLADYLDSLSRSTGTYVDTFGNVVEIAGEDSKRMAQEIGDALYEIDNKWGLTWRNLETNFEGTGRNVEGMAREMFAKVSDYFKTEKWEWLGRNAAAGVGSGLSAEAQNVVNTAFSLGVNIMTAFRDSLKIQSPSRVMFEQGAYVVEGLVEGIRSQEQELKIAMADVASSVSAPLDYSSPTIRANVGFSGGENAITAGGVNVVMNNYINNEMDAEQIDQKMLTAIRRATA